VQLGYVLNVIEDPAEWTTIRRAYPLCPRVLVVAAQVQMPGRGASQVPFGDGVVTGLGTFQKDFGQGELKEYLERELGAEAVPAEQGIFSVFRDEVAGQHFLATRCRRRATAPRTRDLLD
jgi:DNA phosphorothioation-associated putative methyltransferase